MLWYSKKRTAGVRQFSYGTPRERIGTGNGEAVFMKGKRLAALGAAFFMILGAGVCSGDAGWSREVLAQEESSGAVEMNMEDGEYAIQVDMEGGSGKAGVSSPTAMIVEDGRAYARLQWSSSNYDYMVVDGEKYLPVNEEGMNSVFEIPILAMDEPMPVIADTTAMGTPHEVDYTLLFYADSIGSKGQLPQEAAKRVVGVALIIIVGGGILNYFVNKRNRC